MIRWSRPFPLLWSDKSCATCDVKLESGDFVQLDVRKGTRDKTNLATRHYDCEDPGGSEIWAIAEADRRAEEARGHKSETTKRLRSHKRGHR